MDFNPRHYINQRHDRHHVIIYKTSICSCFHDCKKGGCHYVLSILTDQSFDIPDRTFHNLHTSWRLSSAESNTDVKEMIPEFFFTHEFLVNAEGNIILDNSELQ